MIIWPVDEMGRNSVMPSTTASMIASMVLMGNILVYGKQFMDIKRKAALRTAMILYV